MSSLDYKSVGVDYDALDAFKRACQREAAGTRDLLAVHQLKEPADVRGDSAYLLESETEFLAHVEEGLGTKNLVADEMAALTGKSHYRAIGIDTVATIVNDLITCGALPISVAMHAAVGDSAWFNDQHRAAELAAGFALGCREAGAVWGGGETPALRGIVERATIVLAGSAIGRIRPKSHRITGNISAGDAIIFVASSGVQTNGLTLCRALAERLGDGYLTKLGDGRTYGEALLAPSVIYVKLIAQLFEAGIVPSYAVHVTGHGWRKLMRAVTPFVYRIINPGQPGALFDFIGEHAKLDAREMYGTFNMGIGFALYVPKSIAPRVIAIANESGYNSWLAGEVVQDGGRKAVEIPSIKVTFEADSLKVR